MNLGYYFSTKKDVLRIAAIIVLATGAGSCSYIPNWVDPTTWFGDDTPNAAADSGQAPDLANLPEKPQGTSSDEQREVADSLASDRAHAGYNADALKAGNEAAAPPPPDAPVEALAPTIASATNEALPPATKPAPASAPAPQQQEDQSVSGDPTGSSMQGALPSPSTEPVVRKTSHAAPVQPTVAPAQSGTEVPQGAEGAVAPDASYVAPKPQAAVTAKPRKVKHVAALPASQPVRRQPAPQQYASSVSPSDAELGFKPSTAPPLDPSISQFVPAPIVARYKETASEAGAASVTQTAPVQAAKLRKPHKETAMGGPETMSGAVVANLDAIQPTATGTAETPSVYADPQGLPAAAVVFFPGDTVNLNAEARSQIAAAVQDFKSHGGQGYIRVVGHSSSRTADMPVEKHLELIFQKSQQRASAVAQAIINAGIPAAKILVEAVGDSQPVYYESMPKGEDGNRRAEIFLQG